MYRELTGFEIRRSRYNFPFVLGSVKITTIDRLEKAYGEILKAFLRSYSFRDFLLHSDLSMEFILSADEGLEVTVVSRAFLSFLHAR